MPETTATCEDGMAPGGNHPEVGLLHEGETEEADADGDVEDILMEVPVQPAASASSSSAAPAKKITALERCIALNLVYGTGVMSRNGCFELTGETACAIFSTVHFTEHARAQLFYIARMEIDQVSKVHTVTTWRDIFTTYVRQRRNTFYFVVGPFLPFTMGSSSVALFFVRVTLQRRR